MACLIASSQYRILFIVYNETQVYLFELRLFRLLILASFRSLPVELLRRELEAT